MSAGIESSPIGELVRGLDRAVPHLSCRMGKGKGWVSLDTLGETDLKFWHSAALHRLGDRSAAALAVGSEIGQAGVVAWAVPYLAESCMPIIDLSGVGVHHDDAGVLDGVSWEDVPLAAVGEAPGPKPSGEMQVMSREAMADLVVGSLLQLEEPFERLRLVARIGRPALWGSVADLVASFALGVARVFGTDRWEAWQSVDDIIDRLARYQPALRSRPRPFPVSVGEGDEMFGVRGTCCLWYRTCQAASSDDYCTTCPLRSDESRTERLRVYLDSQA